MQSILGDKNLNRLCGILLAVILISGALTIVIPSSLPSAYAIGNKPSKVENLILVFSSTQVTLVWDEPASNGSPITGYKIERQSPTDTGFATLVANTGNTLTHYLVTGLSPSTNYNFKVSAINSFGEGPSSNEKQGTTLAKPSVTLSSTAPNPTNTSPIPVTATFSESVTGFALGDIIVTNGAAGNFIAVSGAVYTFDVTPAGQGLVSVDIPANAAFDIVGGGNTAATTLSRTYDTSAPNTTITSSPSNPTTSTSASFTFTSTEAGTFECQLDASGFTACTTPKSYSSLTQGSHTFQVRAIDTIGNVDPTPASYTWTIDTSAPNTTITSSPSNPTTSTSASFTFTSTEAGTFECQLDASGFTACTTPKSYSGLTDGSHTFQVRAIDTAGNVDATPASYTWTVDATAPVITLSGSSPLDVQLSSVYVDAGATALDNLDGDITGSIVVGGETVDTSVLGTYTITYDVTDSLGNAAVQVIRTVNVVDSSIPIITLNGDNPQTVELGSAYVEAGAVVTDNQVAPITPVIDSSAVDTSAVGSYEVTYDATDDEDNHAVQVIRTVNVVDSSIPIITLNGDNPQTVELGSAYVEAGAVVTDNQLAPITPVIDSSAVDTSAVGSYEVTYDATDDEENNAVQVIRTVNVVDSSIPIITLNGDNPQTVELGSAYVEAGAVVTDNQLAPITPVIDSSAVDTSAVGSYEVTYDATDDEDNHAVQVIRTVNVVDSSMPIITLNGDNPQTVLLGSPYVEAGAVVTDNQVAPITPVIDSSAVDTSAVGSYEVTYDATDDEENNAVQVIRIVNVIDSSMPIITLNGENPQTVLLGSAYVEAGAVVTDNQVAPITPVIDSSAVDTSAVGSYEVTYDATDDEENNAVQVIRTVNVVDSSMPIITLNGDNPQTVLLGSPYVEAGAVVTDNQLAPITPVIDSSAVNTSAVGSYEVTYDATDDEENNAVQVIRTVNVVDSSIPTITLNGDNPQIVKLGSPYVEAGAVVTDNQVAPITPVIDSSAVDTSAVGSYEVTYDATDDQGNNAEQVIRTVNVVDSSIILSGHAVSQTIITLAWTAAPDGDSEGTLVKYDVFRDSVDVGDVTDLNDRTFTDTGLQGNTKYTYQVKGVYTDDTTANSNELTIKTKKFKSSGGLTDITPPSTNSINFYSVQSGTETAGFGGRLEGYSNNIPSQLMNTGVEERLQVRVSDNSGIAAIKHVGVLMNFDYESIQTSDTYFVYEEGTGLIVSDPIGFFGDVTVHRTYTDTEMILTFTFTPQKPMPITDLVISAWDAHLNHKNTIIFSAFEIQGEPVQSLNVETLPAEVPYYKNPAWNQFVMDSDGNMITYDAFGNLDSSKQLREIDSTVVYGSYIGKSERHDDGFYDKVSLEGEKARGVADAIMVHPIYSGEQKIFKTDKVYKYPSTVGKADRKNIDDMKDLKHKENAKAMKVVTKMSNPRLQ